MCSRNKTTETYTHYAPIDTYNSHGKDAEQLTYGEYALFSTVIFFQHGIVMQSHSITTIYSIAIQ